MSFSLKTQNPNDDREEIDSRWHRQRTTFEENHWVRRRVNRRNCTSKKYQKDEIKEVRVFTVN